jgi:hypothetical protein
MQLPKEVRRGSPGITVLRKDWLDPSAAKNDFLRLVRLCHEDIGLWSLLDKWRVLPELLQTKEEVTRVDVVKAVPDEQQRTRQAVSTKADVQGHLKTHALEVARLRKYKRLIVLEIAMKLDDLCGGLWIEGKIRHICNLVKRLLSRSKRVFQPTVIIRRVNDRKIKVNDEVMNFGFADIDGWRMPPLVHPTPQRS